MGLASRISYHNMKKQDTKRSEVNFDGPHKVDKPSKSISKMNKDELEMYYRSQDI